MAIKVGDLVSYREEFRGLNMIGLAIELEAGNCSVHVLWSGESEPIELPTEFLKVFTGE